MSEPASQAWRELLLVPHLPARLPHHVPADGTSPEARAAPHTAILGSASRA